MSPVQIDRYRVRLLFKRLFADPRIFAEESNFARLLMLEKGIDQTGFIVGRELRVTDSENNPSKPHGTATYLFQGKKTRSEYMEKVTLSTEYLDVGSGITPGEHYRFWTDGALWAMPFTLENFDHETIALDMPDAPGLYKMVKEQAQPTTIATVELESLQSDMFDLGLAYLESSLGEMSRRDMMTLEVYAARYLDASEKSALDRRLTKTSTDFTVYVILGK